MKPSKKMYGLIGWEQLMPEIRDVVFRVLEDADDSTKEPMATFDTVAAKIIWPIRVVEFARMELDTHEAQYIADRIIDNTYAVLDDEHGNPDADPIEPTDKVKQAAIAFANAVVEDYEVWGYMPTGFIELITQEQAKAWYEWDCKQKGIDGNTSTSS